MLRLKYRYCKARMTAYINGGLAPGAKRRMARYINDCPDCYAEYVRQRDIARELERDMPGVGIPHSPQLDRMWANIQTEMTRSSSRPARRGQARYGLIVLALILALFLPWAFGDQDAAFAIPSQPSPRATAVAGTPENQKSITSSPSATAVALAQTGTGNRTPHLDLHNTPAPHTVRR